MRSPIAHAVCHRTEGGFTLIELLVTMSVISILAGIALPQMGLIREHAFNAQIGSDARSCGTAEEAYFVDAGQYTGDLNSLPEFIPSQGSVVTLGPGLSGNITNSFSVTVTHPFMTYTTGCVWTSDAIPSMTCA